jgi:nucleoside-diphosphate-sugar epimerase
MRVLVTGASGFVGSAVVAALADAGDTVTATATAAPFPETEGDIRWIAWNATDQSIPEAELVEVEAVIHLASPRERKFFPEAAHATFRANVAATLELAELARQGGIHFIVASTGDVFAGGPMRPRESDMTFSPASFYAASKAAAEMMLRPFADVTKVTVLRIFHPYGPGGDAFLVNRLLRRIASDEEIEIEGPDGILLNPIWIDDLAAGIAAAAHRGLAGTFHLTGPDAVSMRELVTMMAGLLGRRLQLKQVDRTPPGGHAGHGADSARLLQLSPGVGLEEGLRRLVATGIDG